MPQGTIQFFRLLHKWQAQGLLLYKELKVDFQIIDKELKVQLQDTASYEQYFEEKKFPAEKSNQQILSREMVKRP